MPEQTRARVAYRAVRLARQPGDSPASPGQRTRIIMAEYERLVVTYSPPDDSVFLLCPPGTDPGTALGAARLVLPDATYQELAWYLGVIPGWTVAQEAG
jgi:hypothetical protein